jgi:V/A-type H+/Na+-transporting ATPase subunit I
MKARIRKIIIGCSRKESDRLINELGNEGIIHLCVWDKFGMETSTREFAALENSIHEMLIAIDSLSSELHITNDHEMNLSDGIEGTPIIFQRDIESDLCDINSIRNEIEEIRDLRQKHVAECDRIQTRLNDARDVAELVDDAGTLTQMKLCSYAFGILQKEIVLNDQNYAEAFYIRQAGRYVLGISLAQDKDKLIDLLNRHGFEKKEELLGSSAAFPCSLDEMKDRVASLLKNLNEKEDNLNKRKKEIIRKMVGLYDVYTMFMSAIEAKKGFLQTEDTIFMSGWIDLNDSNRLVSVLELVCGKSYYVHMFSRKEMLNDSADIPVRLRNNWFFKAFEMIVKNAGIPGSMELDPTPIATIAYLLMFGIMFGDIGQGLVLSLTGCIMKIYAKRKGLGGFFPDAGTILISAGLSATLFGVLYGSIFSNEHLVPSLWFHPMEHIMDLFFITIMVGAFFISIGIILNIINLYSDGEYFEAIFGIHGILGFLVYTGSLFLAVRYIKAGITPDNSELLLILAFPIGLFFIRNIPGYLFLGLDVMFPNGIFEYVVESFVEIMEMFSGFLGNSISFIRAGAFALSHAGLSIAVYTLAGIAGPTLSIGSLSIIILGNVFIIFLEGLVCGIQSMRLEYYEFFSKFFKGNGIEFTPFSFRRKQVITKGVA